MPEEIQQIIKTYMSSDAIKISVNKNYLKSPINTELRSEAKGKSKEKNFKKNEICIDNEYKEVFILDYTDGYFEVYLDSIRGYINELWIVPNDRVKEFVKQKNPNITKYNVEEKDLSYYSNNPPSPLFSPHLFPVVASPNLSFGGIMFSNLNDTYSTELEIFVFN